jgi:hypothetical protein
MIASYDLGEFDITNPDQIVRRVNELLTYQSQEFWKGDWVRKGFDTRAGREAVVDALTQISRNLRAGLRWDEDIDLVVGELS